MPTRATPTETITCPHCHGAGVLVVPLLPALARQRRKAGLTLQAMATRLGVSKAYLSQVEHGRRKGNRQIRAAYAKLGNGNGRRRTKSGR